ncbi:MAG: carbamoyltransferase [Flavobacteriaceae bacterium]
MTILGISGLYHDSAASIIINGEIIAAAQEERFTRKKQDASFPSHAIKFCLEEAGKSIDDLDAIAFYDKPLLKFERLLETYYGFSPKGLKSFMMAIPVWLKEKMFLKKLIKDELSEIQPYNKRKLKLLFPEHHLSHAASAFYCSPYENAAILTLDGVGEWATTSISEGKGSDIKMLKEIQFPHSIGLLYSAFTYFLGFKVNSGEYKLMGLAPYGNEKSDRVQKFVAQIKKEIVSVKEDGSIWLNQDYFNYAVGLRMAKDKKWEALFGFPRRDSESEFEQHHADLGLAIQLVTEEIIIKISKHVKEITNADYLCLAGGVALNCVANGKLQKENIFKEIFIQPAAGDAGGSLGAALAAHHIYFKNERTVGEGDSMKGSYLGPSFSSLDIEKTIRKYDAIATKFENFEEVTQTTAKYLEEGNAIGWMQGKMEFGPRALGRRSILGDARNPDMQKKLNLKIKYRESFRPFAPSVLAEDVNKYFDYDGISPYMLLVHKISDRIKKVLPSNFDSLSIKEKLYTERSSIPAITHIDFSGRIQTVHKETNPEYWNLINEFKKRTGVGLVVNTSFNVRGEPIVCTPEDAYRCFMRTEMDYLVIENYIFEKKKQPNFEDKDNWKEEFVLD